MVENTQGIAAAQDKVVTLFDIDARDEYDFLDIDDLPGNKHNQPPTGRPNVNEQLSL